VSLEGATLCAYVACHVVLFVFSLSQSRLVTIRRRVGRTPRAAVPPIEDSAWPAVTIQLPIYNERYVVERLLRSVAAIDYPRDRLTVQVLDDSADHTSILVEQLVPELRAEGLEIDHVRRAGRQGFKAGALAYGLHRARGELMAIFDADFVPAPNVLRTMVPHLQDPGVAAVQARWGYLNEKESRLTQIQAFMLDLHFGLEQPVRDSAGLFMNFNGTAGIWRAAAIADAGGWSARTLTEDIDLSYRAQRRGWRLVYLEDCVCPGEIPAQMSALRSQQYRWMKGGAQNARIHLSGLLRSNEPWHVRRHACQHLLAGSAYLVIMLVILLSVPMALLMGTSIAFDYADYGLAFAISTLVLVRVFRAARRPKGAAENLRFVVDMGAFMLFTMGLSIHNGVAVLSGWGRRGGEFVRTPKAGTGDWSSTAYARRSVDRRVLVEALAIPYLAAGLVVGWRRRRFAFIPVQALALAGLGWVTGASLWHRMRADGRYGDGAVRKMVWASTPSSRRVHQ